MYALVYPEAGFARSDFEFTAFLLRHLLQKARGPPLRNTSLSSTSPNADAPLHDPLQLGLGYIEQTNYSSSEGLLQLLTATAPVEVEAVGERAAGQGSGAKCPNL